MILGLEFPPISHLIEWPDIFGSDPFAVNKVVLIMWVSALLAIVICSSPAGKRALVPTGVQNVAESIVDFVDDGIVMQTMGPDGLKFTPFLTDAVHLHLVLQHLGSHPLRADAGQRPHRDADVPRAVGVGDLQRRRHRQAGPLSLLQGHHVPAGRAQAHLHPRDSHRVGIDDPRAAPLARGPTLRQHARRPPHPRHLRGALCQALWVRPPTSVPSCRSRCWSSSRGFEILVAFLQAYIFTILAAVYIGGAMHPEH